MIATHHIRLGTGVVSLPYHHPFMVAQRIVQLDHLTRGRVMLGVGPGALPSDAAMLGIDPAVQRHRMEEALEMKEQDYAKKSRLAKEGLKSYVRPLDQYAEQYLLLLERQ